LETLTGSVSGGRYPFFLIPTPGHYRCTEA